MTDRNISGVLAVDKAAGMTSHDVVAVIRRLYGTRRVGHTGTLDPMATGVLVLLIGKAAKLSDVLLADKKCYEAGLLLGRSTDTQDITGQTISTSDDIPSIDAVRRTVSGFVGKQLQTPPMYSAKKLGGVKLCDLAREGVEIERRPCEIEIYSTDLTPTDDHAKYSLSVACSKGTYIRTLCNDIGERLGCGGCMSSLRRTQNGRFSVECAVTLDKLREMDESERDALLMPIESVLADRPSVNLPPFFAKLARCGCEIYQKKIGTAHPVGTLVSMFDNGELFALGEVRDFADGSAIKPIKSFV